MSAPTSNDLNQLWAFLYMTLKEGKDFVLEQAPSIFQEMVIWGRAWYTSSLVLSILAMIFLYLFGLLLYRKGGSDLSEPSGHNVACVCSWIFCFSMTLPIGIFFYWSLMSWVAPKLYLIETLASYLKK